MSRPILFRAATLVDSMLDRPILDAALLVAEGLVVAMGRAADVGAPDGARQVQLGQVTLVPGLIDAHAHLGGFWTAGPVYSLDREEERLLLYRMAKNGRQALAGGITALRDCGTLPGLGRAYQRAVSEGLIPGPEAVVCDSILTTTGGHLHFVGREVDTAEQMRIAVREQAKAGSNFIKIAGSGGRKTPGRANLRRASQFTAEQLRVAVEESHRYGLRVAVHAHSTASIEEAVLAGVDSVEHCLWLGEEEGLRFNPAIVERMAKQGTFVVPTLGAFYPRPGSGYANDAELPPLEQLLPVYASMREAGVRMAVGGDTGGPHTPFGELVWHLELMGRFGMTPRELLAAATREAAACLDRPDLGSLATGQRADFITVRGEPLSDIRALWKVEQVYRGGKLMREAEATGSSR